MREPQFEVGFAWSKEMQFLKNQIKQLVMESRTCAGEALDLSFALGDQRAVEVSCFKFSIFLDADARGFGNPVEAEIVFSLTNFG